MDSFRHKVYGNRDHTLPIVETVIRWVLFIDGRLQILDGHGESDILLGKPELELGLKVGRNREIDIAQAPGIPQFQF